MPLLAVWVVKELLRGVLVASPGYPEEGVARRHKPAIAASVDLLNVNVWKSGVVRKDGSQIRETSNALSGLWPLLHEVLVHKVLHPIKVTLVDAIEEPFDL